MNDPTVSIRPYRPEDRPAAMSLASRLEIGVAAWRDPEAVRDAVTEWVCDSLDGAGTDDRGVLVAISNDSLVGIVTVAQRQHFTGEVDAYVGELVVAAGYERRGIGTLLMQAAETWSRDRGYRRVTLETGAANQSARAFYAALGYLEEEVRLTKTIPPTPAVADEGENRRQLPG
jgi:ribosomal protein S18 acetylase RimI-like enzyme